MNTSIKSTTHSHSLFAEELRDRTASGSLEISKLPNNTSNKQVLISTGEGLFRNNSASLSTKVITMPLRSDLRHSLTLDISQHKNVFPRTSFNSDNGHLLMGQSIPSTRSLYRKYITKEYLDRLIQYWNNKLVKFSVQKKALKERINAKIAARKNKPKVDRKPNTNRRANSSQVGTDQKVEIISEPEVNALSKDKKLLHERNDKQDKAKDTTEENKIENKIIKSKGKQYKERSCNIKPISNSYNRRINEWKEYSCKLTIAIPFIAVMVYSFYLRIGNNDYTLALNI